MYSHHDVGTFARDDDADDADGSAKRAEVNKIVSVALAREKWSDNLSTQEEKEEVIGWRASSHDAEIGFMYDTAEGKQVHDDNTTRADYAGLMYDTAEEMQAYDGSASSARRAPPLPSSTAELHSSSSTTTTTRVTAQENTLRRLQTIRSWKLSDFQLLGILGYGRASTVYRARHVSTGLNMAIKKVEMASFDTHLQRQLITSEISLHASVYHPSITSFFGSFRDERGDVYMMLEYAKRGDVFNMLYDERGAAALWAQTSLTSSSSSAAAAAAHHHHGGRLLMSESDVCERILGPLISAVAHLHARDIVHRDIKPENLMVSDDGMGCKLADFGFAVDVSRCPRGVSTRLGTPEYCAPEIFIDIDFQARDGDRRLTDRNRFSRPDRSDRAVAGRSTRYSTSATYGKEVDCWAVGIVAYECLVGETPFKYDEPTNAAKMSVDDLMRRIVRGEVDFDPGSKRGDVSAGARDFVSSCLTLDPRARLTAEEMLWHPWITQMVAEAIRKRLSSAARGNSCDDDDDDDELAAAKHAASGVEPLHQHHHHQQQHHEQRQQRGADGVPQVVTSTRADAGEEMKKCSLAPLAAVEKNDSSLPLSRQLNANIRASSVNPIVIEDNAHGSHHGVDSSAFDRVRAGGVEYGIGLGKQRGGSTSRMVTTTIRRGFPPGGDTTAVRRGGFAAGGQDAGDAVFTTTTTAHQKKQTSLRDQPTVQQEELPLGCVGNIFSSSSKTTSTCKKRIRFFFTSRMIEPFWRTLQWKKKKDVN